MQTASRRVNAASFLSGFSFFLLVFWPSTSLPVTVPELAGAPAVVERVTKSIADSKAAQKDSDAAQERETFRNDLKQFVETQNDLQPQQAAEEWLVLFDRFWALPEEASRPSERRYYGAELDLSSNVSIQAVMAAVPAPGTWSLLSDLVEKREAKTEQERLREAGLRLFVYYLNGDRTKLKDELEAQKKEMVRFDPSQQEMMKSILGGLDTTLKMDAERGQSGNTVKAFDRMLDLQRASKSEFCLIKVPDLVSLAGEEKAGALIGKALSIPGASLTVPAGDETRRLARQLVMEKIDEINVPQWGLVTSPECSDLYEALEQRFPAVENESGVDVQSVFIQKNSYNPFDYQLTRDAQHARFVYLFGLIAQQRIDDALQFVRKMGPDIRQPYELSMVWDTLDQSALAPEMVEFYSRLLRQSPELPFWEHYILVASVLGQSDKPVQMLEEAVTNADISLSQRITFQEQLVRAYLAQDKVDQAVELLKRILQTDTGQETQQTRQGVSATKRRLGVQLATLGRLLNHFEWVEESVDRALAEERPDWEAMDYRFYMPYSVRYGLYENPTLVDVMIESRMYSQAEAYLEKALADGLAKMQDDSGVQNPMSLSALSQPVLVDLARLYGKAGRYKDVLCLLETAPWWGVGDVGELECSPLPPIAAEALAAEGRKDEATAIVKNYLYQLPQDDSAYAVLVEAAGEEAIPWLDELYARDRFEERPLIWKAHVLRKCGRLDEAEAVAREALRVDPTDGEQKAGDRVRAYSVLADILEAKGKKEDAEFFRNVVESVRVAEEGDKFTQAGLIKRSLALYEKAATYFADAYCVQWRLAERLYALGDEEGAREHYRIAFERMPEQFGQVASFCFGCEGVFNHQQSRSAAEEVLLRLEKDGPVRPQLYFLLGQLREAQQRYSEAYDYFKKAVEMDPDYLDAWVKIYELKSYLFLPRAEEDALVLKMLRLDPAQKHFCGNLNTVGDLKGLWDVLQQNRRLEVPPAGKTFPLPASAEWIEQQKKAVPFPEAWSSYEMYRGESWRRAIRRPGEVLMDNQILQQILQVLQFGQMPAGYCGMYDVF